MHTSMHAPSAHSTGCSHQRKLVDLNAQGHHRAFLPHQQKHRTSIALHVQHATQQPGTNAQQSSTAPPVVPSASQPLTGPGTDAFFYTESGLQKWVEAMELDTVSSDLPQLLIDMGAKYDPERITAVFANKWPQVYGRALKISTKLGGFLASLARDSVLGQLEAKQAKRARQLREILSSLGPSFVKIGQALSSRPDLLPKTYLDILSDLQDQLPCFPTEIARTVIEEELGRPIEEMYSTFTEAPVAAASLGQVYRATLRSTGEDVAVKVQRPSIGESIAVDMLLLRRLMAAVDRAPIPALKISQQLVPLVDEFAARLFGELDYLAEGHNGERFQKLYGNVPRVRTPSVKWDYTARRVLTMEWIDGVKLTNKEAMAEAGLSVVDFVDVGIECTLRQLLEHGYFHADPHPGNLLATRSGDLVYLDFGMMSEAPQYARYAIMSHVVHLVNRDYDAMCKDYYTLQFMDPSVDTSPIAPSLALFFDNALDSSVSQLNFKAIVDGLGEVLFRFPFQVPSYYALILRSLTVLEGLALQADPEYKLLAKAYPYMARRLLTDPAPELRESFEDLILKDGQFRWSRLENLLREGSKSQDFDPAQLWLLAEWVLSPGASGVRDSVVAEVARMVDAVAAGDVRENIMRRTGSLAIAEQLVPAQPLEADALSRAQLLVSTLSTRISSPTLAVPAFAGALPSSAASLRGPGAQLQGKQQESSGSGGMLAGTPVAGLLQGSGPFGLLTPGDLGSMTARAEALSADTLPRLQRLFQQPGASDLGRAMSGELIKRFTARAIKLVFASQGLLFGGKAAQEAPAKPSKW